MVKNTENQPTANGHRLRFPIRQFLSMFIPVVVVIFAIAFAFANMRTNAQLEQITATERTNLNQLSGYMAAEASTSLNHLLALSQEAVLINAIDSASFNTMQSVFMTTGQTQSQLSADSLD